MHVIWIITQYIVTGMSFIITSGILREEQTNSKSSNRYSIIPCFHSILRLLRHQSYSMRSIAVNKSCLQKIFWVGCTFSSKLFFSYFIVANFKNFTSRELTEQKITPDSFTALIFKELSKLEETKPGAVARCLQPLLQKFTPQSPPNPDKKVS